MMMSAPMFDSVARACATVLADSVVQGAVIALIALLIMTAFRNREARSRFSVLLAALVTVAVLPLLRAARGVTSGFSGSAFRVADAWVPWIVLFWAIGASIALLRVAVGVAKLVRICDRCHGVDPLLISEDIQQLLTNNTGGRRVRLLVSDDINVPSAVGFFWPAVLLPRWVVDELPASELKHVIVHELSHLRRRDDWTNLLQKLVKAVFFFHPAVWWMDARLSLEREIACDDAVLNNSHDARGYAECLAHLAERSFLRRGLAMAQAAVTRMRETSTRVARILTFGQSTAKPMGRYAASTVMILAVGAIGVLWRTPELVSFDSQPAVITAGYAAHRSPSRAPRVVNAAWHISTDTPNATAVNRPVVHTAPSRPATPVHHVRQAQLTTVAAVNPQFVSSSFVVVMQSEGQIAVWRITTWHYQPSQQVRAEQKTT